MQEPTVDVATLSTPYADLLPPLSLSAFDDLVADVEANGQRVPIVVTPDGVVIDGHHRLKATLSLGLVPVFDVVDETHPEAAAIKLNMARRNLSPEQQREVRQRQRELAIELARSGMTQADIGGALGVARQRVSEWIDATTSAESGTSCKPDARVKVAPQARAAIADRVESGETQTQIAADYGVTPQAVSKIVQAEKAKREEAQARESVFDAAAADAAGDGWKMLHGDFRERLMEIEPGSVDLVVTDPPYPAEFLPLWSDLSKIAARILKPQGVLIAMTGKIHLPQVMAALGSNLAYGWMYAQPLPGSSSRILARSILQEWKPWLAYSNGQWPSGSIGWHPDLLDGSSRHKSTYRWEQDPDGARHLIETLSPAGGVVVDPFTGTGAFGVAALAVGRRFVGVELDAERFNGSADRLAGHRD